MSIRAHGIRTLALFSLSGFVSSVAPLVGGLVEEAQAQGASSGCRNLRVDNFGEAWDVLNVRETPNGNIVDQVPVGGIVTLVRHERNGWSLTSLPNGVVGYMFSRYLVPAPCGPVQPPPPPPPPPVDVVPVARCFDAGGSFGGRSLFNLDALLPSWQTQATSLEGFGVDGSTLTATIFSARTPQGAYRSLVLDVDATLTAFDGRQSRYTGMRLEPAAAGLPQDQGKVVLVASGVEKTFARCVIQNQNALYNRAGDFLISRCRGSFGETLSDVVLRLDASGRADRLIGLYGDAGIDGRFDAPINSISRQGALGRRTSYVINTQNLGAGSAAPQTVEVTPGLRGRPAKVTFRYEGSEDAFTSCETSNLFLLDEAF